MNLAFVSTNFGHPWGGAEKPWTCVADTALRDGHRVMAVVAPRVARHARIQALATAGATIHVRTRFSGRSSWRERARRLFDAPARWENLRAALHRFRPDVLLLNQGGVFDFVLEESLMAWCRQSAVPLVFYCHCNSEAWLPSAADRIRARELFAVAHATLFVSQHNRSVAEHQIAAPIPRARVVQSPLPANLLGPPPPWPAQSSVVGCAVVARIDAHQKGLDLLIPALARAWPSTAEWTVNFYGDGPDRGYVEDLARLHGVLERLSFHGFVDDVRAIWAQNRILLMPSRHEGCSLSMLEALACGRPVLATDVGGVSDWLRDGVNGFVGAAATIPLIAETLERAWSRRDSWETMGTHASRLFAESRDPAPEQTLLRVLLDAKPSDAPTHPMSGT